MDQPPGAAAKDGGPLRRVWHLLVATIWAWNDDNAIRLGAALAYYTVFSLAPFLVIVIAVAGLVFGADAARGTIVEQIRMLVGTEGAEAVAVLLAQASQPRSGVLATVIGIAAILLGATAVFAELQSGLNEIWKVPPSAGGAFRRIARARLRSFTLVVGIGFLLLVSLVVSAFAASMDAWLSEAPAAWRQALATAQIIVSFGMSAVLFAMIFKVLPEVPIAWSDVAIGALVTAVLFNAGQAAIGLYLGRSTIGSIYGAAGSLVVILVWVFYSSQVVLLGAEFTHVYACTYGSHCERTSV